MIFVFKSGCGDGKLTHRLRAAVVDHLGYFPVPITVLSQPFRTPVPCDSMPSFGLLIGFFISSGMQK